MSETTVDVNCLMLISYNVFSLQFLQDDVYIKGIMVYESVISHLSSYKRDDI